MYRNNSFTVGKISLIFLESSFVKFEKRLSKYESNQSTQSKLHIFTSAANKKKIPLITHQSCETINLVIRLIHFTTYAEICQSGFEIPNGSKFEQIFN